MKLKTLLIVVILLAALSGAAWFFNRPTPPASASDARLGQPILDATTADQAARIQIKQAGKTIVLVRDGDTQWEVESYHRLPAEFSKLASLVKPLTSTDVERLVTSSPDRIARLGFPEVEIALADTSGKSLLDVTLGRNAESGGGRYLRFSDEPKAYLARLNLWIEGDSRTWVDPQLIRFNAADIAKITLSGPIAITLSRASAAEGFTTEATPTGKRVNAATTASLLSNLANLRFTETSANDDPKAVAARAAARTVTLTTFDGKTLAFAIGRQPERLAAKAEAAKPAHPMSLIGNTAPAPTDLLGATTEKIPAGPVFVFITHSDKSAPVNALMAKRAFQVIDSTLTSLPADLGAVFEPIPPPPAPAPTASTPAATTAAP